MSIGLNDIIAIGGSIVAFATGNIPLGIAILGNYALSKFNRTGGLEKGQVGIQANVMSNEASLPVIYGQARVGMALADIQQQSGSEKVLGYVGALCLGGEDGSGIESIEKVYFNDVLSIDGALDASAATLDTNVQSPWKVGTTFGTDLWLTYAGHYGADAQVADTELVSRFSNWTATDDGRGIAYLALLLYYNEEVWTNGWPNVTALVKGVKCFDPRDSSTSWAASQNPACAIWDFMSSTKYGMGIPSSALNTASFVAAANACDVLVAIPGPATQKRFVCNGWLDPAANPQTNLRRLLSSCRGEIVRIGDEYHLQIRLVQAAESYTLDTTNIVDSGDFEFWRGGTSSVPNLITATYIDPALEFQPNDVSWPEAGAANAYLTADNSFVNSQLIELPFTDDEYRAKQIAQVILQEARADVGVALTADRSALALQQGDVVSITHPTPGWTAKDFWVIALGLLPDGNVRIFGREYSAAAYTLAALSTAVTPPGTNLPDPSTTTAPTNLVLASTGTESQVLQDGTRVPRIKVTWTASADAFLDGYHVRRKVTAEADSTFQIVATLTADETQVYLSDVANGTEYTVEIRAVNNIGVASSWVSDTVTVSTTENAATGSVTATLNAATIQVTWGNGTATGARYFAKATEPTLGDVQGGTATTSSPVTAYTFAAGAELRWVGVLLYTDGITASANESDLYTFPLQYTGAASTLTQGDLQYADATPVLTSLAIGGAGTILRSTGTLPAWSTATIPDTAVAGDVLYASATNVWSSLAKGTAAQVLTMNAGATAPEWATPGGLSASAAEVITGAWTFRSFQPETDSTYSIGVTANRFLGIYADELYAGTKVEIGVGATNVALSVGAANRLDLGAGDSLYIPSKLSVATTSASGTFNCNGVAVFAGGELLTNSAGIATTATTGFLWLVTCAGTPTGVPSGGYSGLAPTLYDTTNNKLWIYDGGWIGVVLS